MFFKKLNQIHTAHSTAKHSDTEQAIVAILPIRVLFGKIITAIRPNPMPTSLPLAGNTAIMVATYSFQASETESPNIMDLFSQPELDNTSAHQPLADAVRPQQLDQIVGQDQILGPGQILSSLVTADRLPSMILWGPPGSGKTTLARLLASQGNYYFKEYSAVTSNLADIKQAVEEAKARRQLYSQSTLIFIDEIHRFNKAQQDAFLPHVEAGVFTLVGATTENPSFSIISALLSRSRVFVLQPLSDDSLSALIDRGLDHLNHNRAAKHQLTIDQQARKQLIQSADGDGRRLLTSLEVAAQLASTGQQPIIQSNLLEQALQHKHLHYDKSGEEHYNLISALHKSVRSSDPQAAVYWLGRMIEAGEDPLYLARRLTRMAAEDIGLADPQALVLAAAAFTSLEKIGMPESAVILAEVAIYLALAPKSNAAYQAYNQVVETIKTQPNQPVPLHLRNAPTQLMKGLGYGKGYKYAHNYKDAKVDQQHLPDNLKNAVFYQPQRGWEAQTTNPATSDSQSAQSTSKPKPPTKRSSS